MISEVENRKHLLPSNRRIERQKLVERFPTLQEVDQTLHRHASTAEAGRTAHALRVDPHCFVEPGFLISSHNLRISGLHCDVMRSAALVALRSDQAFTYLDIYQPISIEVKIE